MNEKTIFQKIMDREIPADIVYEDDAFLVIADLHPVNAGHCLVIPKEPYTNLAETPDLVAADVMILAKKIGALLLNMPGVEGFNVIVNNGAAAGQVIFHTHVHVVPRRAGDGFHHWHGTPEEAAKQKDAAAWIRDNLNI